MSISEFRLQVDGITIAGRQSGAQTSPPVLLLHGSGASSAVFEHQLDSGLASVCRLIAIDLPGHGASGNAVDPASTYAIRGMAAIISGVIDQMGLVRPAVYGWSMGGHIALELAGQRSDLAGLALGGAPPVGPGPLAALRGFHARWDMLLASKENFSDRDAYRFLRLCFGDSGTPQFLADIKRADGLARVHFLRSLMRGDGTDQRRLVETSALPIAMIDGADDPIVRRNYIEHLRYTALWQETCHAIAGAAHAPFWEQPQAFNRLLSQFLRDLASRPQARPVRATTSRTG